MLNISLHPVQTIVDNETQSARCYRAYNAICENISSSLQSSFTQRSCQYGKVVKGDLRTCFYSSRSNINRDPFSFLKTHFCTSFTYETPYAEEPRQRRDGDLPDSPARNWQQKPDELLNQLYHQKAD